MNHAFVPWAAVGKLAVGALGVSVAVTGGVAVGAGWLAGQVEQTIRALEMGPEVGTVTWGSLEDDPPAETVDLSSLIIVGTIDSSTGQVTDVSPHRADHAD